jgi:hypothetical protein
MSREYPLPWKEPVIETVQQRIADNRRACARLRSRAVEEARRTDTELAYAELRAESKRQAAGYLGHRRFSE